MKFDVAVIGGGPAGLSACIFTTRAGLNTICFEKLAIGGQASLSHDIGNYPGFNSISGFELTMKMFEQAKVNGTQFIFGSVAKIKKLKTGFSIKTKTETYLTKKLIVACGTIPRRLGLNEDKFIGKGVSYCASCDGNFFKGKQVAIVGGGDSAFVYAEYLSRIVKKVFILNRSEKFKAGLKRIENVKKLKNVEILTNTQIKELKGDDVLDGVMLNNGKELDVKGVFVAIGHVPDLKFLDFDLKKDKNGYIVFDKNMKTSEENVFACGDIVSKHFRQVITACADGAIAGNSCIGE
ncbi:MAG: FAD-dependent oxidoreductase [Clostridia bacterium]|nr:FAD-dependent oxidoreductase [Clostridia bacterium]